MYETSNSAYGKGVVSSPGELQRCDSEVAREQDLEYRRELNDRNLAKELASQEDRLIALDLGDQESEALARRIALASDEIFPLDPKSKIVPLPSLAVISKERERLLQRLSDYSLAEQEVDGDGACQFRALSHQLCGTEANHLSVRKRVVTQLAEHKDRYSGFVFDQDYSDFLKRMAKPHEWGDHVTLQAAADAYNLNVCLVTSYEQRGFVSITPTEKPNNARTIWLGFWAEVHYSSVRIPQPRQVAVSGPPPLSLVGALIGCFCNVATRGEKINERRPERRKKQKGALRLPAPPLPAAPPPPPSLHHPPPPAPPQKQPSEAAAVEYI